MCQLQYIVSRERERSEVFNFFLLQILIIEMNSDRERLIQNSCKKRQEILTTNAQQNKRSRKKVILFSGPAIKRGGGKALVAGPL